jgi:CubicO group peptidase (beta-lactamase class C family)
VNINIDQLLAHTSGIPYWSIRLILEGTSDDMLEKTIHKLSNISLDTYPGTKHNYATVNYDILALIIEKVSGQRYQNFVTDNILLTLGMTESYFSTGQENRSDQLTKGYKVFFGKSIEYNAPRYNGNIAAGYLVTNVKELGLWINAQLGIGDIPDKLKSAIAISHVVDKETAGYEDINKYYSYGWNSDLEDRVISHSGSNPNYSSQVIVDLEKQEATFVLANSDSSMPTQVAYNLYNDMNGKQMNKFSYDDFYILLDIVFSVLAIITIMSLFIKIRNLVVRKKQADEIENAKAVKIIIGLVLIILLLGFIIIWPYLLNYNYNMIRVWMSNSILVWEVLAVISCVLSIITKLRRLLAIKK